MLESLQAFRLMFSCEYCEIFKNGFFYGTPSLTASMAGPNFFKLHK